MSVRPASGLRRMSLIPAFLALAVASACEKVDVDPELAVKIETSAFAGLPEGQDVTLHSGVDEEGDQTWTDQVSADGSLTFDIEASDPPHPRDFLWMTASHDHSEEVSLDFTVLIGEFRNLEEAANADDVVTPDQSGRVLFSTLRIVEAELLRAANGGQPIRDADTLAELIDELDGETLLDSATALQLAFNTEVPGYPEALTSTEVIINDQSLVNDLILTAGEANPSALAEARSNALRDTELRVGWDTATDLGSRWALFQPGYPGVTGDVLHFDSASAGRIGSPEGVDSFTWTLGNGVAELDFAGDVSWQGSEEREDEDGDTVIANFAESYESATVHRIAEGQSSDLVLMTTRFLREFEDDSFEDETREVVRVFTAWRDTMNSLPESGDGRWAFNLPRHEQNDAASQVALQSNGMGEVLSGGWFDGETINWTGNGGLLRLDHPDGDMEIRFLKQTDIGWFAYISEIDNTGMVVHESVDLVDRGDEAFPDDAADLYIPYAGPPDPSANPNPFVYRLQDSGDALEGRANNTLSAAWVIENDDLVLRSCLDPEAARWVGISSEPTESECNSYRRRQWDLISLEPNDEEGLYMVLEHFQGWSDNDFDAEPDAGEYQQLFFLERRALDEGSSNATTEGHRKRSVYIPGRGHPDPGIGGS